MTRGHGPDRVVAAIAIAPWATRDRTAGKALRHAVATSGATRGASMDALRRTGGSR